MTWILSKINLLLLLFGGLAGFSSKSQAQSDSIDEWLLSPENLQFWFDSSGLAPFDEAVLQNFQSISQKTLSFGYNKGAVWLRVHLTNTEAKSIRLWMEFDGALLSSLTLYRQDQKAPLEQAGLSFPRTKADSHRSPVLNLDLAPDSAATFYVRVSSQYALYFNPHIHTSLSLGLLEKREGFFLGAYAGVMLFNFVLVLYIYIRTRFRNFLFYSMVLLSFHIFYQFSNNHVTSLYFWPQFPWWSERAPMLFVEIAHVFGAIFVRDTLQTPQYTPRLDWWMRLIPLRSLSFGLWILFDFSPTLVKWSNILSVLLLFYYYFLGLYIWRRGSAPARYFSIAWLPVLIASALTFMQSANLWVARDPFWQQTIRFGFPLASGAIQAILLGLAVGHQFRSAEKERAAEHQAREKLEQGMDDAHAVQEAFIRSDTMTTRFEIRSSHQMSAKIGGDWLGYHHQSQRERLILAISDVTGHGLPSALLTGSLHGAFYGLATAEPLQTLSGPELLQHMMSRLDFVVRSTAQNSGLMATMALLSVDLKTYRIDYLNAGHTPVLVSGSAGQHYLLKGGSPLGINDNPQFGSDTWQGRADDVLFLFTDGLLELSDSRHRSQLKIIANDIQPGISIELIHQRIEGHLGKKNSTPEDDSSYILCRLIAA